MLELLLYNTPCVINVRLFLGRELLFSPVGFFSLVFFLPFPFLAGRPHLGKARKMGTSSSSSSFLFLAKCHSHSHLQNTRPLPFLSLSFPCLLLRESGRPFLISDMDGDGRGVVVCRRVRGWGKENTWSHDELCYAQVYAFARFYIRLLEAVPFRFSDLLHSTASMDLFDPLRSGEK